MTGYDRKLQETTGINRKRQETTGQVRTGQEMTGQVMTGNKRSGQVSHHNHYNNKNIIKMDDLIVITIVEILKIPELYLAVISSLRYSQNINLENKRIETKHRDFCERNLGKTYEYSLLCLLVYKICTNYRCFKILEQFKRLQNI